jgi:aspartyl-tRNA(Asn)/glutamyl-tRNA(Gln) amidotransferase subunit A
VMAGADEFDSTVSRQKVPSYSEELGQWHSGGQPDKDLGKIKVAYLSDCLEKEGLDPEIKARTKTIIAGLIKDGHSVEPVEFPFMEYLVPTYYVLTTAEASSNLARYQGLNFGYRSKNASDMDSTFRKSRSEGFGKEVQRRIMLGTFVLSSGYYDAYYSKGQKVRRFLQEKTLEILNTADFILLPSTPGTAFKLGENSADPIKMYLEDIFTVLANIAGLPAISIPLGKHSNGLPFGLQLIGRKMEEGKMLAFSEHLMGKFKTA